MMIEFFNAIATQRAVFTPGRLLKLASWASSPCLKHNFIEIKAFKSHMFRLVGYLAWIDSARFIIAVVAHKHQGSAAPFVILWDVNAWNMTKAIDNKQDKSTASTHYVDDLNERVPRPADVLGPSVNQIDETADTQTSHHSFHGGRSSFESEYLDGGKYSWLVCIHAN